MRRPLLIPHLRRLWRDPNTLQLGIDPRLATVLHLANPAVARVLDLLDGSRSVRAVLESAADFRVADQEVEALLTALRGTGLLVTRQALLPVGLTDSQRDRMAREAGALALERLRDGTPGPAGRPTRPSVFSAPPLPPYAVPPSTLPPSAAPPSAPPSPPAPPSPASLASPPPLPPAPTLPPAPQPSRMPPPAAPPSASPASTRPPRAALPSTPASPSTPSPPSAPPPTSPAPASGRVSLTIRPDPATPAEMLRRRAAAKVLVAGHAWLGALIAAALGAAGVGRLDPALDGWTRVDDAMLGGLLPADVHRSRASAAADAVRRIAPEAVLTPLREGDATFVVRVGSRPGSALATRGVRERGVPRLDVYLRDGLVIVGPLVLPAGSPCADCLDFHREDRDSAWPALSAQLRTSRDAVEVCGVTTALAGAAYAAEEVLRHTDGRPVRTIGAVVEVSGPGAARRRTWPAHPRCDCSRRRRSSRSGRQTDGPSNNGS